MRSAVTWIVSHAVFAALFTLYSCQFGVEPVLMHDDFEYTYPVQLGGTGRNRLAAARVRLNVAHHTYHFAIYYYASTHAPLIRIFEDVPESIPIGNTFHVTLRAGA